jgi:MarR family transcriptional regulator, organic hydroperoxide resistance regulator
MVANLARARPTERARGADDLVASVHDVIRLTSRHAQAELEAEGISMGQFWALRLVSRLGPASVSTVARHLSVSCPTVSAKVDQLEAAGLVRRHRSERDHRAVEISLTPKGRRIEARVWARVAHVVAEAAKDVAPRDVATAVRVFEEMARHLAPGDELLGGAA